MEKNPLRGTPLFLFAGDALTLAFITLAGLTHHGELSQGGARFGIDFCAQIAAWLLVAPHLGVYDPGQASNLRQLWRPFWAMVLAGPLAAWLRGAALNSPIPPVFVVVWGGSSALGLLAWRLLAGLWLGRESRLKIAHRSG